MGAHEAAKAAKAAEAAEAAKAAEAAEAAEAKAATEASPVADEVEEKTVEASGSNISPSAMLKAMPFADKMTPERMKKVAAGALGIWGVAAGAGWVMNSLGGAQDQE